VFITVVGGIHMNEYSLINIIKVKKLFEDGYPKKLIAKELGLSLYKVNKIVNLLGLKKDFCARKIFKADREYIREHFGKKPTTVIAKHINCSSATVRKIAKEMNIPPNRKRLDYEEIKNEIREILKKHKICTIYEIAEHSKFSLSSIRKTITTIDDVIIFRILSTRSSAKYSYLIDKSGVRGKILYAINVDDVIDYLLSKIRKPYRELTIPELRHLFYIVKKVFNCNKEYIEKFYAKYRGKDEHIIQEIIPTNEYEEIISIIENAGVDVNYKGRRNCEKIRNLINEHGVVTHQMIITMCGILNPHIYLRFIGAKRFAFKNYSHLNVKLYKFFNENIVRSKYYYYFDDEKAVEFLIRNSNKPITELSEYKYNILNNMFDSIDIDPEIKRLYFDVEMWKKYGRIQK